MNHTTSTTPPAAANGDLKEPIQIAVGMLPGGKLWQWVVSNRPSWLVGIALLLWFLVVYPLILPFVSAWLINWGALRGLQDAYATTVRKAFRAEEFAVQLARDSNQRMDYYQVIEFVGNAGDAREYTLSAVANQKLKYRIERASLFSHNDKCPVARSLLKPGALLYSLQVHDREIAKITLNPNNEDAMFTADDWKAVGAKTMPGRLTFRIVPVPALADLSCEDVKVDFRITFEVYKDLVGLAQPAVAAMRGAT